MLGAQSSLAILKGVSINILLLLLITLKIMNLDFYWFFERLVGVYITVTCIVVLLAVCFDFLQMSYLRE